MPTNASWWVGKAEHDRTAIGALVAAPDPPWDILCFHAQQLAEKYLKALLVHHGRNPPKIHDLETLLKACVEFDNTLSALVPVCALLTQFGGLSRYTDTPDEKFEAAAGALVAGAEQVRSAVRASMGLP